MVRSINYTHDIFISCPISFIKCSEQFESLRKNLIDIEKVLIESYGFEKDKIYCELRNYDRFEQIPNDSRHLYFKARQLVPATHYIALVPEGLHNSNSGIYMEIYFRIQNKLPGIIFVEDRGALPSLLYGLIDSNDKPVNISFRDCDVCERSGLHG